MLLAAVTQVLHGTLPVFYLAAATAFVASAMTPLLNSHSQTIWQTQTRRELQGRVFSVRRVIAQCTFPVGTAISGWVGGLFSPGAVIAVAGTVAAVFCVVQLFNPQLLKVEDKAMLDEMAARAAVE